MSVVYFYVDPRSSYNYITDDEDRLQAEAVLQDKQVGIETQLPVAVLHLFRDQDLEAKVYTPASFRHIPEPGGDLGGIQGFVGHHVSVLVLAVGETDL